MSTVNVRAGTGGGCVKLRKNEYDNKRITKENYVPKRASPRDREDKEKRTNVKGQAKPIGGDRCGSSSPDVQRVCVDVGHMSPKVEV